MIKHFSKEAKLILSETFSSNIKFHINYLTANPELNQLKPLSELLAQKTTAYAMITSCLSVMLHYLIAHTSSIFQLPLPVYGLALGIAIFSTVIPTFMVSKGIHLVGANRASIIASVGPVSTIILGFIVLGETITGSEIVGTIMVLAGVLLVSMKE